jgi:hypothetical protein
VCGGFHSVLGGICSSVPHHGLVVLADFLDDKMFGEWVEDLLTLQHKYSDESTYS